MKPLSEKEKTKLLDFLDGKLSHEEKLDTERLLASQPELHETFEQLKSIHNQLKTTNLIQPSKNFTQVVMSRLDQLPATSGLSTRNSILLLAGVMIAVGLGALLLSAGVFDTSATINLNEMGLKNEYIKQPLPSIPFNGKLVVNIIIMLNIALAFIVLDRAILKPWFNKRARMNY